METACSTFAEVLGAGNPDLPFAIFYLVTEEGSSVHRFASAGYLMPPRQHWRRWTLRLMRLTPGVLQRWCEPGGRYCLRIFRTDSGDLPGGTWPGRQRVRFGSTGRRRGPGLTITGVLVAGVNPRRALDDPYRGFSEVWSGRHMAIAVTNARSYEEERKRARTAGRDRSGQDPVLLER